MSENKPDVALPLGVGLDIGTMNLVSARRGPKGVETKRMRDVFLDLPPKSKKMLKLNATSFVERADDILVLGDAALETANMFGKEPRRPLSAGIISPREAESMEVLGLLIKSVLGEPRVKGEVCYFSIPAEPIDQPNRDVIYHKAVFEKIIGECGYSPYASNEGMGIIYSETAKEGFSGIALSFGSGMTNVALAINTIEGLTFSVARCLAEDFPVVTQFDGITAMGDIKAGDRVLDADGSFVEVLEKTDNGTRPELVEVRLENLPAFPHRLTVDHRVFVHRRFGWEWVEAGTLTAGDEVGIPTIQAERDSGSSYYFGRDRSKSITVAGARNLGKFFGLFLGDGSCGGSAEDGPRFVQLAINRRDQHLVEKYANVCNVLFGRDVGIGDSGGENLTRVKLHITAVARHMRERFYSENGTKIFPLEIHKISNQMALGIIEGLLDSDGCEEPKRRTITNTSVPIVMLVHHLLNRFGIEHGIQRRPLRDGGINSKGIRIKGNKESFEVRICGHVSKNLLDTMLLAEGNQVFDKFPDFMTYKVSSTEKITYRGHVYDLRVASNHHSFSSPGMIVHNCGDWIDFGAAQSIGATQANVCAIKEQGIDLNNPQTKAQQAVAFYYQALLDYVLDQIAAKFKSIEGKFSLTKPIPLVVSGGTSLAGGFMEFFTKVFEARRKRFPVEISEIRAAGEPLNAVAYGMLVQAIQEHEEG